MKYLNGRFVKDFGNRLAVTVENQKDRIETQERIQKNSKYRGKISSGRTRVSNEVELWIPGFPVLITQKQVADRVEGGLGLYLGIQNLTEKCILAVYVDVECYSVLKEKLASLKDVCFLDMDLEAGEIYETKKGIELPDPTIRFCDVYLRHVVFTDETIWSCNGDMPMRNMPVQQLRNPGHETEKDAVMLGQEINRAASAGFRYEPDQDYQYWRCACGQVNGFPMVVKGNIVWKGETCIACGSRKDEIFKLADQTLLAEKRAEREAREEADRARMEAKRKETAEQIRKKAEILTEKLKGMAEQRRSDVIEGTFTEETEENQ